MCKRLGSDSVASCGKSAMQLMVKEELGRGGGVGRDEGKVSLSATEADVSNPKNSPKKQPHKDSSAFIEHCEPEISKSCQKQLQMNMGLPRYVLHTLHHMLAASWGDTWKHYIQSLSSVPHFPPFSAA